jgi:hypothetical protein
VCRLHNTKYVGVAHSRNAFSRVVHVPVMDPVRESIWWKLTEMGFLTSIECIETMIFSETVLLLQVFRTKYESMSLGIREFYVYCPKLL